MSHRRFSIFAAVSLVLAGTAAAFARSLAAIERFVDIAFAVLARPEPALAGNGGFTGLLVGHRREYDAPPLHSLRHEAGTSRRAADRHI